MATVSMRFSAEEERVHTAVGEKIGGIIRLRLEPGFGLYGPYVDLPAGPCIARIFFDGPALGHATIDILAEGYLQLASRVIDLGTLQGQPLEISADLDRSQLSCEVRLACGFGVHADISGIEIEICQFRDTFLQTEAHSNWIENFKFLFTAMLLRSPTEGEIATYLPQTNNNPAEAVSLLGSLPEFVMKHPSFTPKPMAESLVPANINGIDLLVPTNDWVHWGTAQGWDYEKWVADAMRQILKPGSIFVDIGANTGVLTMLGASLVGDTGHLRDRSQHRERCANLGQHS